VQALLEARMRTLCEGICSAHGARCTVEYTHEFAPTVNWAQCVAVAVRAAQAVVGAERVDADTPPMMISEDFGRFLQHMPGAFVFIGNGAATTPAARRCTTPATTSTTASCRGRALVCRAGAPAAAAVAPALMPRRLGAAQPFHHPMILHNPHAARRPYDADLRPC
jgi:metal-dependent amidase/aminoacylase/carboxypeptidase family protein